MKTYYFVNIEINQRASTGGHKVTGFHSGISEVNGEHTPMDVIESLKKELSEKYEIGIEMLNFLAFNKI